MIHARIEPKLKRSAERIFSEIGMSTTEGIRLFLKQVELHRGLPFSVSIPNAETVAAMRESEQDLLRSLGISETMWKLQELVFTARRDDFHIAPSVSAGMGLLAKPSRADAWGYVAATEYGQSIPFAACRYAGHGRIPRHQEI